MTSIKKFQKPSKKNVLIIGANSQDGSLFLQQQSTHNEINLHATISSDSIAARNKILQRKITGDYEEHIFRIGHRDFEISDLIDLIKPDLIYHFAGYTKTVDSEEEAVTCFHVNSLFTAELLSAVNKHNRDCDIILCNSIYALANDQNPLQIMKTEHQLSVNLEQSANIYAMSKKFSLQISDYFRRKSSLRVWNLLLHNHEDILRDNCFLPRKLSIFIAEILVFGHNIRKLELGDLNAVRDWSPAINIVNAIESVSKKLPPGNYILGSGKMMTVRELIILMFSCGNIEVQFIKDGETEKIYSKHTNTLLATTSVKFTREQQLALMPASETFMNYLVSSNTVDIEFTLKQMIDYDVELISSAINQ